MLISKRIQLHQSQRNPHIFNCATSSSAFCLVVVASVSNPYFLHFQCYSYFTDNSGHSFLATLLLQSFPHLFSLITILCTVESEYLNSCTFFTITSRLQPFHLDTCIMSCCDGPSLFFCHHHGKQGSQDQFRFLSQARTIYYSSYTPHCCDDALT